MNAALLDTHTGKRDAGLEADAALEARIDAAYQQMRRKDATDEQSRDSFGEFYRLVLQRSQIKQVALEMERRMGAR